LHEIYVKDSGDWFIHANYTHLDRRKCLADAEELFKTGRFDAVRVIKESYDPAENTAREEILYRSPCRPRIAQPGIGMPRSGRSVRRNASAKARQKPKSEYLRDGPRFAADGLAALLGAAFPTFLLQQLMRYFHDVDGVVLQAGIGVIFVVIFVSIFVSLTLHFKLSLREETSRRPQAARRVMPASARVANPSAAPAVQTNGAIVQPSASADEDPSEEDFSEEDFPEEGAKPVEEMPLREIAADVSTDVLKSTGRSLELLSATNRKMDTFNRFGMTLYFAGAAE
jgi:hypothetical protein